MISQEAQRKESMVAHYWHRVCLSAISPVGEPVLLNMPYTDDQIFTCKYIKHEQIVDYDMSEVGISTELRHLYVILELQLLSLVQSRR